MPTSDVLAVPQKVRAAIYARFSCDKQRDASIDDQVEACTNYCLKHGYEVIEIYADYALSGRSDERPRFIQMIDDCAKRRFDVIVVWKLDRFARNMKDQYYYEHIMDNAGVWLESVMENIAGGDIESDMNKGMLAIFAQLRSQQSAQDTMRGMLGKATKCQYLGYQKFGYDHEGDVITLHETNAPIAYQMHEDYLAGVPVMDIIDWLISLNVKTVRGNDPGYQFVTGILKDLAYAGVYTWGKKKDARGRIIKDENGAPIPLVCIEGGMPAIVTMETKLRVLERLGHYKHSSARIEYLFSGKIFRAETGDTMHGETGKSQSGEVYLYYVSKKGKGRRFSVRKESVEKSVAAAIRMMLRDEALCHHLAARHVRFQKQHMNAKTIEAVETELKGYERQQANLLNAVADGLPYANVAGRLEKLNVVIARQEERLKKLRAEVGCIDEFDMMQFFADISAGCLKDEDLLKTFVSKVLVYDDGRIIAVMAFEGQICSQHEIECRVEEIEKAAHPEGCAADSEAKHAGQAACSTDVCMVPPTGIEPVSQPGKGRVLTSSLWGRRARFLAGKAA